MPDRLTALVERLKEAGARIERDGIWPNWVAEVQLFEDAAAHLSIVAEVAREMEKALAECIPGEAYELESWHSRLTTTPGATSEERSD